MTLISQILDICVNLLNLRHLRAIFGRILLPIVRKRGRLIIE
jgi:hypothetical protein